MFVLRPARVHVLSEPWRIVMSHIWLNYTTETWLYKLSLCTDSATYLDVIVSDFSHAGQHLHCTVVAKSCDTSPVNKKLINQSYVTFSHWPSEQDTTSSCLVVSALNLRRQLCPFTHPCIPIIVCPSIHLCIPIIMYPFTHPSVPTTIYPSTYSCPYNSIFIHTSMCPHNNESIHMFL